MKKNEMRVGGIYRVKVNNMIQTVRLDRIEERLPILRGRGKFYYYLTNLSTGRETMFRSAAKFVAEVK